MKVLTSIVTAATAAVFLFSLIFTVASLVVTGQVGLVVIAVLIKSIVVGLGARNVYVSL